MTTPEKSSLVDGLKTSPTTEEKIGSLEEKFAILEEKFNGLHEKALITTKNSADKANGVAVTQDTVPTNVPAKEDKPLADETCSTSRARVLVNRSDPASGERKDQPPSNLSPAITQETDKRYAFTLRKNVYEVAEENGGEIEINNEGLWNLLKEHLSHHPYHIFQGSPVILYSPYEAIIFEWERLEQATKEKAKDETDLQARSDLRLLLDTIASGSGDAKLDKYLKARDSNEQKSVTFETLWTIFAPGTLIFGRPFQGQDQVFVVQDNIRTWPSPQTSRSRRPDTKWSLLCWTYDWNGKMFRRLSLKIDIEQFYGYKPISSLPYYPLKFNECQEAIEKRLIRRGLDYRQFCTAKQGARMFEYSGDAIFDKKGFSGVSSDDDNDDTISRSNFYSEMDLVRRLVVSRSTPGGAATKASNVEGRVMVDFESYFRYGPSVARVGSLRPSDDDTECGCVKCRENEGLKARYRTRFDEEANQKDSWEDEQYMLCPPRVLGYVLRDKQWAQLQVTSLKGIPKEDPTNSWSDRLKLADGEETKTMLLDLVNGHGKTESTSGKDGLEVDDIVVNKGKGLVILLYGPPGVGKTSTAETVAIAARKPLFSISVADVGTKAKNVEANLAKIFALATSWQAVLLIDEADVFLESRGMGLASNTERNALVSVFLRVLEYYKGVLILTTNQIAQFDVAVQSRIHIAIKYSNLNKSQTMAIFDGFLQPLYQRGLVKNMEDITDWLKEDVCKMGFDGRQIRNIVTSALNLARAQGKSKLDQKDMKKVLNNVKEFKDEFIRQYERYRSDQQGMMG